MSLAAAVQRNRVTIARVLALAASIGITLFVFSLRGETQRLAAYGYPGIFVLSLLANATVILPAPGVAFTFAMGAVLPPPLVALVAGSGAALGEITGYLAGFSGQGLATGSAFYEKLRQWTAANGVWAILVLALIPNPFFDIAGATAGLLRMRFTTFLLATWAGKVIKMLAFAYAGAASFTWLEALFP
ncbi:MAG TPA: VTT domain-containing protein [Anaerolineales bacterium]|nr:VTT domain-containing protein [Anaerolineales bacterium]